MLQPDLGTALMITAGGVTVMFLAGVPLRLFIGGALALAAAVPLAVNFLLHDYQRNRILIFLDPESDPLGTGYHISQSKIAIGSGGIFGKGFLNGTQSHLDYLPEGHTDFVFATMAEEWGLIGGVLLIIAFFAARSAGASRVALRAQTRFARLTAAGLPTTIFFYVAINMMMVMGLAPVVGMPLPLISYGGSAHDDGDAVHRHPDVDRPPEPPSGALVAIVQKSQKRVCNPRQRMLTGALPRGGAFQRATQLPGMDA